jgi:hypothetical protein
MSIKDLALSAAVAGIAAAVLNLVVEYWLNGGLVSGDYLTSAILAVLTGLVIFLLFRNRSR